MHEYLSAEAAHDFLPVGCVLGGELLPEASE
jgi:hypothetical protein